MYGGLSEDRSTTGPQWIPELQWYVEEETSSRKVYKSSQEKKKLPQWKTNLLKGRTNLIKKR